MNAISPMIVRFLSSRIATRLNLAFFVAGLAFALITCYSDSAAASCGDYLIVNGKPVADHQMPEHESDRVPGQQNSKESPFPSCSGPNCSNRPAPGVPNPEAPTNLRSLGPADLVKLLDLGFGPRRMSRVPESERGAFYLPSEVFRPPAV